MPESKTCALVTGATAGIGAEFCRQLAARCDVIIAVGRREPVLRELASSLSGQVEMQVVLADLTSIEGQTRVIEALRQKGPVDYLINNAGFGAMGQFADVDLAPQQAMVDLHVSASLALCRAAIPFMREKGEGYIVNVSSLAAFTASAGVYGASKAFLNYYSESLQGELADTGIKVQSLCPGFTHTQFHARDSMAGFPFEQVPEDMWMEAADVVRESLVALGGDKVVLVTGCANQELARAGVEAQLCRLSDGD